MKKVVVLGSLNMDLSIACDRMPENGETRNGYGFLMNPGGKGGNQAVAAARATSETCMIANIGNDAFGIQLKDALRTYDVNVHYVRECPLSSGIAVILRSDHDNRIILDHGANHTMSCTFVTSALTRMAQEGDIFLTQLENNLSAVACGLKTAKEKGMYTIFNPAPALALPKEIFEDVDLFVVNQSECQTMCGIYPEDEVSIRHALHAFLVLGCDVIITLGKQGSAAYVKETHYRLQAYQVDVRDTTGAGDTYVGVLCAMLAQEESMDIALQYANAASALAVMKEGAQCSIPSKTEIEQFIKDRNV